MSRSYAKKRRVRDGVLKVLVYGCAALTVGLLALLIGYIFARGLPGITWQLLSTAPSALRDTIGILPNILNTLYLIAFTLLLAPPAADCRSASRSGDAFQARPPRMCEMARLSCAMKAR